MLKSLPEQLEVKDRVWGGHEKSARYVAMCLISRHSVSTIAPKVISAHIAKETKNYQNLKLDILLKWKKSHPRDVTVICNPSTSVMILKCSTAELPNIADRQYITAKLEKGGYEVVQRRKMGIKDQVKYSGQITFENICRIAKQLEVSGKSQAKEFNGTVKSVLATAASLGLRITGGKHPKFVLDKIAQGKWAVPPIDQVEPLLDERGNPVDLVIEPERMDSKPATDAELEAEEAELAHLSLGVDPEVLDDDEEDGEVVVPELEDE